MSDEIKLIQNKGSFVIKGVIEGKDNPANNNGYKKGTIEKGKNAGSEYKSIKFKVKTSNDNIIPVELFGMEMQNAYFYNKKEKKTAKVEWSKRFMKPKDGYELILPQYDLVERINTDFKDGDVVRVIGEFQPQSYKDAKGVEKHNVKYIIKIINKSEGVLDFDSDKFEETNSFTQETVINDVEVDTDANKLFVHTYIIAYGESFNVVTFEVDINTANPLFIKTLKNLKFGDYLKFFGKINYRVINEEIDGEFGKQTIKDYKKSLEITGADGTTFEKGMYKEEDFAKEETETSVINWGEIAKNTDSSDLPFNLD
jgi:hypothetical protein